MRFELEHVKEAGMSKESRLDRADMVCFSILGAERNSQHDSKLWLGQFCYERKPADG